MFFQFYYQGFRIKNIYINIVSRTKFEHAHSDNNYRSNAGGRKKKKPSKICITDSLIKYLICAVTTTSLVIGHINK
jgi:hypothetical protein